MNEVLSQAPQVRPALNFSLSFDLNLVLINCVFKRNEIRLIILIVAMNKATFTITLRTVFYLLIFWFIIMYSVTSLILTSINKYRLKCLVNELKIEGALVSFSFIQIVLRVSKSLIYL